MDHLAFWLGEGTRGMQWVMNGEWLIEIRRMVTPGGRVVWEPPPFGPELLFGMPVDVRDDGGVPHLEPRDA